MPDFSLASLRGLLPQMSGANFGTAGPQELADMPLTGLDKAVQGGVSGIAQQAMVPGQLARPNPYPEGSEAWSWYNDQKAKIEGKWGPETAMTLAGGAGVVPAEANSLRMGIKAYHGSPHDFDAFDLSKDRDAARARRFTGMGCILRRIPERAVLSEPTCRQEL